MPATHAQEICTWILSKLSSARNLHEKFYASSYVFLNKVCLLRVVMWTRSPSQVVFRTFSQCNIVLLSCVTQLSCPPWKMIFTCRAVYALLLQTLLDGAGFYIIYTCYPMYMKTVLNYDIKQVTLFNCLQGSVKTYCLQYSSQRMSYCFEFENDRTGQRFNQCFS